MSESAGKTVAVAAILCGVCSILVASAVVVLRPMQEANKALDAKKNILKAAGLYVDDSSTVGIYEQSVTPMVIDLNTGMPVTDVDAQKFDQEKADKDAAYVEEISKDQDYASIRKRSRLQKIFLVKRDGGLDQVVLHVYGKGLWSTMKGFLSVDKDGVTIRGFKYYAHGETPGLGGEIENPKWAAQWAGKKLYDDQGEFHPKTKVVKGVVNPTDPNAIYQIDGLSGATLTSRGVEKTFAYWFSDNGYKGLLANLRQGVIQ